MFQYRQRYQEGYNTISTGDATTKTEFQYRQRYQEGYNKRMFPLAKYVLLSRFNTDNGIRRATMKTAIIFDGRLSGVSIPTTVSGGLQSAVGLPTAATRQTVSIPTTVSGGLQCAVTLRYDKRRQVSIPTTVSGGLQYVSVMKNHVLCDRSFNTDNGIRRATIKSLIQYTRSMAAGFNTDNGIRRATILCFLLFLLCCIVSIPTTVSGGLQSADSFMSSITVR